MSQPFKKLIRLAVRAFYSGPCPPKGHDDQTDGPRSKLGKVDTSGLAIVVMDYMINREWVPEAEIVDTIKVHAKLLRKALKYLEREHLLMSEHRRETKRGAKRDVIRAMISVNAAIEAENKQEDMEEDEIEIVKAHTISYYAVDYTRFFDALQLKLHLMKKVLKDELDAKEVVAKYACTNEWCRKEFDSFEVHWLIKPDGEMQCDVCDNKVEVVFASGQTGDDMARRKRREMLQSRLQRMEAQLKDILHIVSTLKGTQPPYCGSLVEWAIREKEHQQQQQQPQGGRGGGSGAGGGGGGGSGANRGGAAGTSAGLHVLTNQGSLNYWQDTQVQVNISSSTQAAAGPSATQAAAASTGGAPKGQAKPSVLPPWMLRPGMAVAPTASSSGLADGKEDDKGKKSEAASEEEARQAAYTQAYMKAYAEAMAARSQQHKMQLQPQQQQQEQQQLQVAEEPGAKRIKLEAPPSHAHAPSPLLQGSVDVAVKQEESIKLEEDIEWTDAGSQPVTANNDDLQWEEI